jgi:Fe-S cluster assembly protein SufD
MPDVPAYAPEHARDRAAAEAFAAAELPTTEDEVWRYSRIGDLDLTRYAPALAPGSTEVPECAAGTFAALDGTGSLGIATVDGHVVHTRPLGGRTVDGLVVDVEPERPEPKDPFALLNDAFAAPVVLRVPPGAAVDPVVVVHWVSAPGVAAFPRVVLDAGADSDVTLLEVFRSVAGGDVLVVAGTDLHVGKAARVQHLVLQHLDPAAWQLGTQRSDVDADATLTGTNAGFGGAYARVRTDCRLVGRGATGNLRAVWFGEGDQHLDFRTFQDHAAPDTTSDLVYKGAVGGRSRSVYTGLIKVRPHARGTNAVQTNRNLKLSEDAWAESVPNLEIENNDVRCAHASAVGPVDEEQRWYLESRGVPTRAAERLIVAGFFEEVIGAVPVPPFAAALRQLVGEKLEHTVD